MQLIDLASNIQSQLCAETESEEVNILWFVSGILKGQVLFSQDPGDILKVDVQGKVIETLCVVRVVHADNTASAALLQVLKRKDLVLLGSPNELFCLLCFLLSTITGTHSVELQFSLQPGTIKLSGSLIEQLAASKSFVLLVQLNV